jgi:hypothetical protein
MKIIRAIGCLAVVALAGVACLADAGKAELQAGFGKAGLESLSYDGQPLLGGGVMQVTAAKFENAQGTLDPSSDLQSAPVVSNDGRTVRRDFAWGMVQCDYEADKSRLIVKVSAQNNTDKPLGQLQVRLLDVRFPRKPAGKQWDTGQGLKGDNRDDVTVIGADYGTGMVVACNDNPGEPLRFGFSGLQGTDKSTSHVELDTLLTNVPQWDPVIAPGQTVQWQFSLRFAPSGTIADDLAADVYARLAQKHPYRLKWADRRPVGMLLLSKGNKGWAGNPRGWSDNPKMDITTPEGMEKFRQIMVKEAARCAKVIQDAGGASMIFWDLEGQEMPHPTTYLGNPLVLKEVAPEMDAVADDFFKEFGKAGVNTGICIRPSKLVHVDDPKVKVPWVHRNMGYDVVDLLCQKIEYARKRWGTRIFYMDTDVIWAFDRDKKPVNMLVTADMFRKVTDRYPDILIVPEFAAPASYAYVACYHEVRDQPWANKTSTPSHVLRLYPQAFSVLNTADGKFEEKHDALVASSRRGDMLMFRGWWGEKNNQKVRAIYEESRQVGGAAK